jgi:teichuronic acid biosynthesis glycosyltransferase TuaC
MEAVRLLTFSTLFPHAARANHGIFVENRLRHLVASGEATSFVLAPVPWFPGRSRWFGDWAVNARAPAAEIRHGIAIDHPRYPVIPKLGMSIAPWLLYQAMVPHVSRLLAEGHRFDAIDAHYIYPDGVAACWLGRRFGLPVAMTARGTDVNLIPRYRVPRRLIEGAIRDASALIAVSRPQGRSGRTRRA